MFKKFSEGEVCDAARRGAAPLSAAAAGRVPLILCHAHSRDVLAPELVPPVSGRAVLRPGGSKRSLTGYLDTRSPQIKDSGKLKSSDQRKIRQAINDQYPLLEPYMEQILPKKAELQVAKCEGKINVVTIDRVPLFYNVRDGPYYPTLRVHHQYPFCMPTMRVDGILAVPTSARV